MINHLTSIRTTPGYSKLIIMGDYQGNNSHITPARPQNDVWKPLPAIMLVMGLSGCGKSSFINSVIDQAECTISTGPRLRTRYPRTCRVSKRINECEFRFIDTPGFANDTIDDRKVLEHLVEYFAPRGDRDGTNLPRRVTGLLYIHSGDEPFKGRTSRKTIEMLVKVLGEQFLDRVTVLVRSQSEAQDDLSRIVQSEDSPLYPLYCNNIKPWATIPYTQDPQSIQHILGDYITVSPRLVRLAALDNFVQRDGNNCNWQYNDISHHLRELFPADIGPLIIADQADVQTHPQERQDEIEKVHNLLAQKEQELKDLQSAHAIELKNISESNMAEKSDHELQRSTLCKTIREQGEEISVLQSSQSSGLEELEELKELSLKKESEIKLLQEELQAKEKELVKVKEDSERTIRELMEAPQAKGNETLELKNRVNGTTNKKANKQGDEIDHLKAEISRINAEYASLRTHMQLQENTEQADIMKALSNTNRLIEEFGQIISEHIEKHMEQNPPEKVLQPQDLLSVFGRVESKLASKIKQDAYLLFEYAVQAIICDQLYTHLFKPFHPSIDDDRNNFITQIYCQLVHQAPQTVSGRWRRDTFNSISRSQGKPNGERMHGLITGALVTLIGKIDGIKPSDVLKEHDKALVQLITKAEGLNHLLKGSVSVLGDFQPIAFPFGQAFQPSHMSGVVSKRKKPIHPETILATVGLGLTKSYALGRDQEPEETVLCTAVVFGLPK
ncbi:unnamed protein product [Rhizoctonia solani]|uniref:G domain-containing protein n=1 Tax=Rhizoctonia solani TaxID=456999 RepID=A0A8H3B7G1_9AGAM|nr:unnamed protein product [Rhizoctonia solani]